MKKFINEDSKHFSSGFTVDLAGGGVPRLICYINESENVIQIHQLKRTELRNKIIELGFEALETLPQLDEEVTSEL